MTQSQEPVTSRFHIFTDDEIRQLITPYDAVGWMKEAVLGTGNGQLICPPRVSVPLNDGDFILTAGSYINTTFGYRIYDTLGLPEAEQIVLAHDGHTGKVSALAIGSEIALRRTAALGGVAHDALAPHTPLKVAIIGPGNQGQGQLWALNAVREISSVALYSRNETKLSHTAQVLSTTYDFPVTAATSAEEAVKDADVVIMATTSTSPVIQTSWLKDDVYVATLGPKQGDHTEFDKDLLRAAKIVTSDSLEQLNTYDPPVIDAASGITATALADHVATPPPAQGIRVYLSVGLAGTEPYLLYKLAEQARNSAEK